jgi:2'-5' RNA ligase
MRLFVALALPDAVTQALTLIQGGVPGARWQRVEQMHLTLRFIGEVDGLAQAALKDALSGIDAPAFTLALHGVGQFGNNKPHSLWAGVRPNPALNHLQRKVDNAIRRVGQPQDAHKFMPHVTLARMRRSPMDGAATMERMRIWLTANALYSSEPFQVEAFHLYSSHPGHEGSLYPVEEDYPLRTFEEWIGNDETDN